LEAKRPLPDRPDESASDELRPFMRSFLMLRHTMLRHHRRAPYNKRVTAFFKLTRHPPGKAIA
jgi:hypothetical protein